MKLPITLAYVIFLGASLNLIAHDDESSTPQETTAQQTPRNQDSQLNEVNTRLNELEAKYRQTQNLVNEITQELRIRRFGFFDEFDPRTSRDWEDETKGFIGVHLGQVTDSGIPIAKVVEGAPANIAGIEANDVIFKVGDVDVSTLDDPAQSFSELVKSNPPGSIIQITLLRDDTEMTLDVATVRRSSIAFEETGLLELDSVQRFFDERVDTILREIQADRHTIYVMEFEEDFGRYFGVKNGVVVLAANEVEDIQAGDVLLKIDDKPIRTVAQALRHIRAADDDVTIGVKRNNREKQITLKKSTFSLQTVWE